MNATPRFIKAIDPEDLLNQVQDAMNKGEDLYQPLFLSHEELLCQPVTAIPCMYEYRLIIADELDDLELQTQNLTRLDFDPMFNIVLWHGKYLQWMCRLNNVGQTVRDAVASLSADRTADLFITANRNQEMSLVEGVREYLHIKPLADDALVAEIPFPTS